MNFISRFLSVFLLIVVSVSICAQDLSVYKHWSTNTTEKVIAQPWSNSNNIINGWDWSLPAGIKTSPTAFVNIPNNPNSGIPCRNLDQIRMTWNELEPTEGTYRWDLLRTSIDQSIAKGYSGVVLRIWGSVWEVVAYPDRTIPLTKWPGGTLAAPRWLRSGAYKVPLIEMKPSSHVTTTADWQIINCDIMDAVYHEKYKRFIRAFGASGIPAMNEVALVNLTYRSHSMGEEFTDYKDAESTATPNQIAQRTQERIDVWVEAFGSNRRKLMYVKNDEYAGKIGIGTRGGYVEMYNHLCHVPEIGQYIDEYRYMYVDENNPFIKSGVAFGDENEEYSTTTTKFGNYATFGYRYMISSLMMLKMRRNYAMLAKETLNPGLLYWTGLEMGRTIEDTPDVWCWLNECYLSSSTNDGKKAPVKNVERWLFQRDSPGYETEPYLQVPLTKALWYNDYANYPYDYVARRGLKMGFAVDDRYLSDKPEKVAIKITFYDGIAGTLKLVYNDCKTNNEVSCKSEGTDAFKTATFFITIACKAKGMDYDLEIHSPERVPVNMVRVIRIPQTP